MPEPEWKTELAMDLSLGSWKIGTDADADAALEIVLPHIEAAYQRGLQAGRSQAGYSTRRKSKEGPCRTGTAGAAGSIPASPTGES
ncbi:hypothetical protein [Streptomyces sp. enrichment culture]|uniref:hypothetical protein n=1 Tax=Streptomyces sp. enrichment culture TaxID=1795815 RepID=UPI003F568B26